MANFFDLKDKNDSLLIAPLNVAVLIAPYGTAIPDSLIGDDGAFATLDKAWKSVGEIEKKSGVELTPETKFTGIEGYGSAGNRREFLESDNFTVGFTAQETRLNTLKTYFDLEDFSEFSAGKGVVASKAQASKTPEYSVILIGYDGVKEKEIYPYWIFPKATLSSKGKISLSETDAITFSMEFTAKFDTKSQTLYKFGIGGPGFTSELHQAMKDEATAGVDS